MPKEIIYGSAVSGKEPFHVKVGWTADREVQVGVESDEGRSLFWILTGTAAIDDDTADQRQRRLAELGAMVREKMSKTPSPAADDIGRIQSDACLGSEVLNILDEFTIIEFSGVWATLDRVACNRLINNIRKARDSAYGRDE